MNCDFSVTRIPNKFFGKLLIKILYKLRNIFKQLKQVHYIFRYFARDNTVIGSFWCATREERSNEG